MTTAATPNIDHDLMVDVSRGNLASMSEIYRHRHRALFRFFFRVTGRQATSEDLVHEVFLRMIRYRHTYSASTGASDGFEPWMYRIARNVLADNSKKHRLETPADDGELESIDSGRPTAFDSMVKQQDMALLYRAMRELPDEKRELLVLSRFQGLSYEKIGQIVGCETGTAKVRVFRAVKAVGQIFSELRKERVS
jgi:RNA polymerase sigma factor (sigma-70 family)